MSSLVGSLGSSLSQRSVTKFTGGSPTRAPCARGNREQDGAELSCTAVTAEASAAPVESSRPGVAPQRGPSGGKEAGLCRRPTITHQMHLLLARGRSLGRGTSPRLGTMAGDNGGGRTQL